MNKQETGYTDVAGIPLFVGDRIDIFGVEAIIVTDGNPAAQDYYWVKFPNGVMAPLWAKVEFCRKVDTIEE